MNLTDYLEKHAEIVPHMQTAFLLRLAAQELREHNDYVVSSNFYIKQHPNGDFSVVYE